ncbi:MAG: PDZ domain-containing protein [Candidatus Rokuibacteriota bacterium]|nr:MAG: PDZ domain-containing protein [Candidatus Rokubacteria bacterium]
MDGVARRGGSGAALYWGALAASRRFAMARRSLPLVLTLVAALLASVTVPLAADEAKYWREDAAVTPAPELVRFNQLLADLAEQLKPALVHIRVRRAAGKDKDDESEPRRSSGSGFVIEPSGLIVTNAHVVEDANWLQVRLADGRRFNGKVIGQDSRVDLALVRIDGAANLPTLPLGDSNRLRVGEFVMAIGHPFGLDKSGGPLVNMAGQVVGVNSMAARNGSIGFAIPANLVKLLVPQLATKGKVEWGWLGVSIAEIGDDDVDRLKLAEAKGVLVRGVMPGEPADRGGLKPDDVLIALDGTPLDAPRDLQRVVSTTPIGTRVRVMLLRGGEKKEVEVTIGRYKEREEKPSPR